MNKIVIFSAVVGGYDKIRQPMVVDNRFDFVLFSNDIKENQIGVWQIRPIPYHNEIQTKIARWVKTHPEELLNEYEASLWMDANIQIASDSLYKRVAELFEQRVLLSTVSHPKLTCVYREMLIMIYGRYEKESVVIDWGRFLRKEGFPREMGLVETGVLYRKHSEVRIIGFDQLWWWCIDHYSRRDQLSFNYSLWKRNLEYIPFFCKGENVRNSLMVKYYEIHVDESKKWLKWSTGEAWLGRCVLHDPGKENEIADVYYYICGKSMPHVWAFLYGQLYRIKDILNRRLMKKT